MTRWRKFLFGLVPAIVLFGGTEVLLRLLGVPEAKYLTEKFEFPPAGSLGRSYLADDEAFWRLRPTHDELWGHYKVTYTHEWQTVSDSEQAQRRRAFPDGDYYGAVRWQVNRQGTRGPVPSPGSKLVLCVGSSVTFGWGVRAEDSFAGRLWQRLRVEGYSGWDVVNAGVPNYSSYQALVMLRRLVERLCPAVILFEAGINDGSPSSGASDARFAMADQGVIPPHVIRSSNTLLALYLLVRGDQMLEAPAVDARGRFYTSSVSRPDRCRVSRSEFLSNLQAVEVVAERCGAVVYFMFPGLYNEYGRQKLRKSVRTTDAQEIDMFSAVLRAAGVVGAEVGSATDRLKPRDGSFAEFFIPYDEAHLSRRGHEVVAAAIWQRRIADGAVAR